MQNHLFINGKVKLYVRDYVPVRQKMLKFIADAVLAQIGKEVRRHWVIPLEIVIAVEGGCRQLTKVTRINRFFSSMTPFVWICLTASIVIPRLKSMMRRRSAVLKWMYGLSKFLHCQIVMAG